MGTAIRIGRIIRGGAATVSSETMRILVENESKVQEICAEIDARCAVIREQEQATQTALTLLETASDELAARESKLVDDMARLDAERESAAELHRSDMAALSRRTVEVAEREAAANERDAGLDDREAALNRAKVKFRELTDGLKALNVEQMET